MISPFIKDNICALSTAQGLGAIAVIRISGDTALIEFQSVFSKNILEANTHTAHFGKVMNGDKIVDEVLVTLLKGDKSFTGETTIEISCHGSPYIQKEILNLLLRLDIRLAKPGEFTMRAFYNGKMDLSQAEAVADLIASESEEAHKLAMHQMRGGFSSEINGLREQLINFASLIELELDFSEEDVEFADRQDLKDLVDKILIVSRSLADSFSTGNVIKNGVPVAIIGAPNMGKSTLLNALLNEDRAIVSDIAGTTRDTIEDSTIIDGIQFRFIDTAGIRETEDEIESLGIIRSWEKAKDARIVLYLFDKKEYSAEMISALQSEFSEKAGEHAHLIFVANKSDLASAEQVIENEHVLQISALAGTGIEDLKNHVVGLIKSGLASGNTIVTNSRHYEALINASNSLAEVREGLDNNITGDFLAIDIRKSLHHLGEITGEITTDDLLGNIFPKFCIGK